MCARAAVMSLLMLMLMLGTAFAQEARRPAGDASARLQQQVQQLASERTALQSENARLKEQVAKLEKDAKAFATEKESLTRRAGTAESKVGRAEAGQQAVSARLEATEVRLKEVVGKYRDLAEQLRQVETERSELARQAAADKQGLKVCSQNNVELADIALEALDRYERKGCFGALAQAEPFTGLKRVEVENAVEAYRQQIDTLQVPATDSAVKQ
jgi:chromosome segregation ATPase